MALCHILLEQRGWENTYTKNTPNIVRKLNPFFVLYNASADSFLRYHQV